MDYKQHKGNLRGQIKNQAERKLYNKRIRAEAIDVDTSERQLTIPDVRLSLPVKITYRDRNGERQFEECNAEYAGEEIAKLRAKVYAFENFIKEYEGNEA